MVERLIFLLRPLLDRVSALFTIHFQKYTLLEAQHTERLYRELIDELLFLDSANEQLQSTLCEVIRSCSCIESDKRDALLAKIAKPIPIGVGTARSDSPDSEYMFDLNDNAEQV